MSGNAEEDWHKNATGSLPLFNTTLQALANLARVPFYFHRELSIANQNILIRR